VPVLCCEQQNSKPLIRFTCLNFPRNASGTDASNMPDDLAAMLTAHSLSHLGVALRGSGQTVSTLESRLAGGRTALLSFFKEIGITSLKDRQGLANALAKTKRERESGGAPTPAQKPNFVGTRDPNVRRFQGENDDCDAFGTRRGAHMEAGVCIQFIRAQTMAANGKPVHGENDPAMFKCFACGRPSTEHADLGPVPVELEDGDAAEFDFRALGVTVSGERVAATAPRGSGSERVGGGIAVADAVETAAPALVATELSAESIAMFNAGTDPLALVIAEHARQPGQPGQLGQLGQPGGGGAVPAMGCAVAAANDPLGLRLMERMVVRADDVSNSSSSSRATSKVVSAPHIPPPHTALLTRPAPTSSAGCSPLATKLGLPQAVVESLAAVEPSELQSLVVSPGGVQAIDRRLKRAGVSSMGHRLKVAAAVQASTGAATAADTVEAPPPVLAASTSAASVDAAAEQGDAVLADARRQGVDVDANATTSPHRR
jgi:hypothetical protein